MSYAQLTPEDRYVIAHLKIHKLSLREIGRRLGRHHTTIARELKRNGPGHGWVYWYTEAQAKAESRKRVPRHYRRRDHAPLFSYVTDKLRERWSPECIAGRLPIDFPRQQTMRVSPEGIYRWVYQDALKGGQLFRCLDLSHKRRRRQRRYGSLRGLIPGRVSIVDRPAVVDARTRFGDWEGDTVYGRRSRHCLLTQVERRSRYLLVSKVPNRTASAIAQAKIAQFSCMPRSWLRTLTLDNGKEFAAFKQVERETGLSIYFANPYSAWQRGANENANGRLRRYFPKGTDFSKISNKDLAAVADAMNNRPRKCLGYRTPAEVVRKATSGAVGS